MISSLSEEEPMSTVQESRISIERYGLKLGAVVSGIELRSVSAAEVKQLRTWLDEHHVLFFRAQNLTEGEFLDVAGRLGPFKVSQPGRFLGVTNPIILHERKPNSPPATERWHTDVPFVKDPPVVGVLAAVAVPAYGGETAWVSTHSLYEDLSAPMKRFCEALYGEHKTHETVAYFRIIMGDEVADRVAAEFPMRLHPLVMTHPRTGRRHLYLGAAMASIADLSPAESDLLLNYLRAGLNNPDIQVRWKWTEGDVAIWDERSTMHRKLADELRPGEQRILRSTYVEE
jgi:taurine dioxygenase